MKPETKAKIKAKAGKIWRKVKDSAPGILFFGGVTAVTVGAMKGYDNSREIRNLHRNDRILSETIDGISEMQSANLERMLELERQQNLLFERALKETEGKAE